MALFLSGFRFDTGPGERRGPAYAARLQRNNKFIITVNINKILYINSYKYICVSIAILDGALSVALLTSTLGTRSTSWSGSTRIQTKSRFALIPASLSSDNHRVSRAITVLGCAVWNLQLTDLAAALNPQPPISVALASS